MITVVCWVAIIFFTIIVNGDPLECKIGKIWIPRFHYFPYDIFSNIV